MQVGEQVVTLHGETKQITSILARPGPPEKVYNLEVNGEHTYFVGQQQLLVHNNGCKYAVVYLSENGKHLGIEVNGVIRHLEIDALNNTVVSVAKSSREFGGFSDFVRIRINNSDAVANFLPSNLGNRFQFGSNSCLTYVRDALKAGGADGVANLPTTLRGGFWNEIQKLHVWDFLD